VRRGYNRTSSHDLQFRLVSMRLDQRAAWLRSYRLALVRLGPGPRDAHAPSTRYAQGRRRSPCAVAQRAVPARKLHPPVPVNSLMVLRSLNRPFQVSVGCPFHWVIQRSKRAQDQPRLATTEGSGFLDFLSTARVSEETGFPLHRKAAGPCSLLRLAPVCNLHHQAAQVEAPEPSLPCNTYQAGPSASSSNSTRIGKKRRLPTGRRQSSRVSAIAAR